MIQLTYQKQVGVDLRKECGASGGARPPRGHIPKDVDCAIGQSGLKVQHHTRALRR